jgi:hypothetical protein
VSTSKAGSPAASAEIWRWRASSDGSEPAPRVRLRASVQALAGVACGLASLVLWSRPIAYLAFSMAALVFASAWVSPGGLYAGLQRLFDATGRAIGRAMTWLLLAPLFYLFFLPFGAIFRRGRRDRLRRYFDADADTYWEPHAPVPTSSWERQY